MRGIGDKTLSRRQFLCFSTTVVAGAMLAACVPAQPQTNAPAAQAPVELTLLMVDWNDDTRKLYEQQVLPAYAQTHSGLTVSPDWTGWSDLDAKVMTAFASGLEPDVFQADNVEFGPKYYQRGIVAELDDLVASTADGAAKIKDFYTKAIEEGCKINGKLIAIPYILDNRAAFYRKDLLQEAGQDSAKAFESWDTFRNAAIAMTQRDGDNFTRAGWWSNTGEFCFQTYVQFLWQNGGSLLNATADKVAFDSDAGIEALAYWTKLIQEDKVGPTEDMPNVGDLSPFSAGQLAMIFTGYGLLLNVQKYKPDLQDKVGVTLLGQKQKAALWYANTFFLSKKQHISDAWTLLTYLVFDDDNFRKYQESLGGLPPRQIDHGHSLVHYAFAPCLDR